MQIVENVPLAPYTTFKIGGPAKKLVYAQTDEEILAAAEYGREQNLELLVFGGGSNILVSDKGFDGFAVRTETIGIDLDENTLETVILKVASGELWDDVVRFAVEQEWYGIENLSHIPGFTGAFAVQNVGAYGQEARQVIVRVDAYDMQAQKIVTLTNNECNFGYRTSIFNTSAKDRYIILYTYIKLQKSGMVNLSYADVRKYFDDRTPTLAQMRSAIITIRDTKFPFPDQPSKGNAGSFFNAPVITAHQFDELVQMVTDNFDVTARERLEQIKEKLLVTQGYKVPYAFLIEQCGLKGYQIGGAKVNESHPGVIVNITGTATAQDVISVAHHVIRTVHERTGVKLNIEPRLIGF